MAITRAQQAKQLLAQGGRTGFFLGGNYDKNTVSKTTSAQKSSSKPTTTTYTAPTSVARSGPQDLGMEASKTGAYAPGVSQGYEVIGGQKRAVITEGPDAERNAYERSVLKEIEKDKYDQEVKDFIDEGKEFKSGFTGVVGAGVDAFGRFNNPKQRAWFAANVANNKYGYTLEDYEEYEEERRKGNINAYGRKLTEAEKQLRDGNKGGPDTGDLIAEIEPVETLPVEPEEIVPDRNLGGLSPLFGGSIYNFDNLADGGRAGLAEGGMPYEGGIMNLESGRQMYFLGKLVKKATRAVKKIVKSPLGKAALFAAPFAFNGGLGTFLKDKAMPFLFKGGKFSGGLTGKGKLALGGALTLAPLLMGKQEEEDDFDLDDYYKKNSMNIANIRNNPYNFLAPSIGGSSFAANGGLMRTAYAEGSKEPVAKETMPLIDMDGKEMDLRAEGGFVPIGRMEKADDVPARLSKNEFVFTADAVRNAGEGDIDKGAEVMYNMMKNLESGGEVSEESQGLDGAREMFKTSQRLEEVI